MVLRVILNEISYFNINELVTKVTCDQGNRELEQDTTHVIKLNLF